MLTFLAAVDSTNEYIKKNAPLENGDGVYSLCQTNGKGRRGRSWVCANGKALALSVFISDGSPPLTVPVAAAVAVCEVLRSKAKTDIGIKWPNDIVSDGRKLAGILCETAVGGYTVGIGINLFQNENDFTGLPYAVSLKMLGSDEINAEALVKSITERLTELLKTGADEIRDRFARYCVTVGKEIKVITPLCEYRAQATGIGSDGSLTIEHDGKTENLISGEVSVRGIYGYDG